MQRHWRSPLAGLARLTRAVAPTTAPVRGTHTAGASPGGVAGARLALLAGAGAGWVAHGALRSPTVRMEGAPAAEQVSAAEAMESLDAGDAALVGAALDATMADLLRWQEAPLSYWEEIKSVKVGSAGAMQLFTRRTGNPGGEGVAQPLFLGVIIFDDVSMDEMRYLTAAHEGCAKLRFDPALNTFETRKSFTSPSGNPVIILRTHTHPMLLGIISAREVNSICGEWVLPDGRYVECGFGLKSPRFEGAASGSPRLRALQEEPTTKGMVQAIDFVSGYIHEPMDEATRSGGRGRCRCWYFLCSEAGGSVPKWASERGVSTAIAGFFTAAHKELLDIRRTGRKVGPLTGR